jgi:Trypsin-like peptidase domain
MKRAVAIGAIFCACNGFTTMAMPVPPEIKSVVTFIFVAGSSGTAAPQGTGFFVNVKDPTSPDRIFGYLVTAKHVLQTDDQQAFRSEILIRLNVTGGESELAKVQLTPDGKNKNVFVHPDSTVDIAVVPALPGPTHFEIKTIPEDLIVTKDKFKELKIREGSEVFFTGLFAPFVNTKRNYPVVRFGRVALVTDERIDFGGVKAELYLMETNAYGGNSGSPVFFYLGSDRQPGAIVVGNPVLELAGVMSGRFNDAVAVEAMETSVKNFVRPSMGIAGVVPAYKLHEILFSKELVELRSKAPKSKSNPLASPSK